MSPEELALFGVAPSRVPGEDDGDPTPAVDVGKLKAAEAAVEGNPYLAAIVPPTPPPPDIPPPEKAKRKRKTTIMPDCSACGASLNPDNGSELKDGTWKHVGCPATGALFTQSATPEPAAPVETKTEAPKPAEVIAAIAAGIDTVISATVPPKTEINISTIGMTDEEIAYQERVTVAFEFGPKTLAILERLLAR